jgi:signal transduction histidine kinase
MMEFELDLPEEEPAWSEEAKKALFRVWNEAVTNALRHSRASMIRTTLALRQAPAGAEKGLPAGDQIFLEVADDGVGITEDEIFGEKGFGLHTLRERVNLVQGKVEISGAHQQGTVIKVWIPMAAEEAE